MIPATTVPLGFLPKKESHPATHQHWHTLWKEVFQVHTSRPSQSHSVTPRPLPQSLLPFLHGRSFKGVETRASFIHPLSPLSRESPRSRNAIPCVRAFCRGLMSVGAQQLATMGAGHEPCLSLAVRGFLEGLAQFIAWSILEKVTEEEPEPPKKHRSKTPRLTRPIC